MAGRPVLTAELPPVHDADRGATLAAVEALVAVADAVNLLDNASGLAAASPLALAQLVLEAGGEPVVQLTCRDRNRLALESELLGAALLGARNILCLGGDRSGSGPARPVFDLDSRALLELAAGVEPSLFLGATENPGSPPHAERADWALAKADAGARFFQLQIVFELGGLRAFLEGAAENGLAARAKLLPTLCVPRSAAGLRYLRDRLGIAVPAAVVERIERRPASAQGAACLELVLELARGALELPGAAGLHVSSFQGPAAVAAVRQAVESLV